MLFQVRMDVNIPRDLPAEQVNEIKDEANQSSKALLLAWKSTDEGKRLLQSKSYEGYVYSDIYYKDIE